ncbi:hypothetical protein SMX82_003967 [Cronobacter sakazakii]|nr:hypothetical protein [Cronobacter sakazakii]
MTKFDYDPLSTLVGIMACICWGYIIMFASTGFDIQPIQVKYSNYAVIGMWVILYLKAKLYDKNTGYYISITAPVFFTTAIIPFINTILLNKGIITGEKLDIAESFVLYLPLTINLFLIYRFAKELLKREF